MWTNWRADFVSVGDYMCLFLCVQFFLSSSFQERSAYMTDGIGYLSLFAMLDIKVRVKELVQKNKVFPFHSCCVTHSHVIKAHVGFQF